MADEKKWYQSKTIWGGLLVAGGGIAIAVGEYLQGNLDLVTLLERVGPLIGIGLGLIGVRYAKKPIK